MGANIRHNSVLSNSISKGTGTGGPWICNLMSISSCCILPAVRYNSFSKVLKNNLPKEILYKLSTIKQVQCGRPAPRGWVHGSLQMVVEYGSTNCAMSDALCILTVEYLT